MPMTSVILRPTIALRAIARVVRRLARADRGAAAAEFAIVVTILVYMLLNVVDLGMYVYARMQVENAAQAAAEKVVVACEFDFEVRRHDELQRHRGDDH